MTWIDISRTLGASTPTYPGDPRPRLRTRTDRHGITVTRMEILTHSGTHLDFPAHVIPSAARPDVQRILGAMIGPARIVRPRASRKGAISLDALRAALPGRCPRRLLLRAGPGCGLAVEAARWLAARCALVGIDSLSIDPPGDSIESHRALLGAGVLVLENLRLDGVVPGSYHLVALPLLLEAKDGSPVRAILGRRSGAPRGDRR
jgi:arylformamidase